MPMTMLQVYALRGSISYGEMTADRLRDILLGDAPAADERASLMQALVETDATALNCNPATALAEELGMTLARLEVRCVELTGYRLDEHSFTELARRAALDNG